MHSTFRYLKRFDRLSKLLITLTLALIAADATAISNDLIIRKNDEQGNFEIDYTQYCSDKCYLQESTDYGATWTTLENWRDGEEHHRFVVTDKPDGTYEYRIKDYEYDWEELEMIVEYIGLAEVIVGPVSPPPTIGEQLAYEYETRVGDIDSDGLKEVFLNRISVAPANNGTIRSVILKQISPGTFETIVPNTPQIDTASSWPTAAIDVLLADVNLDGFADVRLDGVGNVIPGVYDQLVYSPAVAYTEITRNVRSIDPNFEAFANDLMNHYLDKDYFTDRATQIYEPGDWDVELDCELDWRGILGWEWICNEEYVWEPGGWTTVYTGVNSAAVSMWEDALLADAGQLSWETVVATLANQLRVDIQIGSWCVRIGPGAGNDCENAGIADSILSLFVLLKHQKSPKARSAGTVYLTGHNWAFIGPIHTAVEITINIAGLPVTRILSAEKEGSYLKSIPDRPEDVRNVTLSSVTSYLYAGQPLLHFAAMEVADSHFKDDCLIYEPLPRFEFPLYFNSNSYTAGLLGVTGGLLAVGSMSDYVGGQMPVPDVYFTSATPCP